MINALKKIIRIPVANADETTKTTKYHNIDLTSKYILLIFLKEKAQKHPNNMKETKKKK